MLYPVIGLKPPGWVNCCDPQRHGAHTGNSVRGTGRTVGYLVLWSINAQINFSCERAYEISGLPQVTCGVGNFLQGLGGCQLILEPERIITVKRRNGHSALEKYVVHANWSSCILSPPRSNPRQHLAAGEGTHKGISKGLQLYQVPSIHTQSSVHADHIKP